MRKTQRGREMNMFPCPSPSATTRRMACCLSGMTWGRLAISQRKSLPGTLRGRTKRTAMIMKITAGGRLPTGEAFTLQGIRLAHSHGGIASFVILIKARLRKLLPRVQIKTTPSKVENLLLLPMAKAVTIQHFLRLLTAIKATIN